MGIGLIALKTRLAMTSKGFIGQMPRCMTNGDLVAIFHGCPVPYLVYPTHHGDGFQLLGNCYVHRIRYGEALRMPDLSV
jgi:hypothetical protein